MKHVKRQNRNPDFTLKFMQREMRKPKEIQCLATRSNSAGRGQGQAVISNVQFVMLLLHYFSVVCHPGGILSSCV